MSRPIPKGLAHIGYLCTECGALMDTPYGGALCDACADEHRQADAYRRGERRVRIHVGPDRIDASVERMRCSGEFRNVVDGVDQVYGTLTVPPGSDADQYIRTLCSFVLGYQLRPCDVHVYAAPYEL